VRDRAVLPCPVRGGVGCKWCSSSVLRGLSVRVCALLLRCNVLPLCVFWRSLVLSFRLKFLQLEKPSLRVLQSMGKRGYYPRQLAVRWSRCWEVKPGSELGPWRRASSFSRIVEVLQVPSLVGALGFAAAPAPLASVSVRFRLSSCLMR